MILAGLIAARAVHYLALALAFGAVAYRGFAEGRNDNVDRRLRSLAVWSSVSVLLSVLAVLAFTAANLVGDITGASDLGVWTAVVQETDFGRVWATRIVLGLLLLAVVLDRKRTGAFSRVAALALAGGLVVTVALTGHAQVEAGLAGWAHRASDAVHLIAAAVWIGVLPPLLYLLMPPSGQLGPDVDQAARRLQGFHAVGTIAVVALTMSGLINSWFLVGDVGLLFTTPYGRVLVIKLALFVGMVALAADNRLRLVPGLVRARAEGRPPEIWLSALRRHIGAELALAVGVLAAVAVMGAIAPAVEA